jgi:hypothetical protein
MVKDMAQPSGQPPGGIRHLLAEAQELRERLHRIAIGLSITEDMAAEAFEQLAVGGADSAADYRDHAQRSRATADECRQFAQRLEALHGEP